MKASAVGRFIGYGVLLACVVASFWLVQNRQYVLDQIAVSRYQPSAEVANLAKSSSMSSGGQFYFYASEPKVDGTQAFNSLCDRKEQQNAILGCYTSMKIYIYDISNPQLDGVKEVTASHEMLHAAWDRLSDTKKREVGALLENEYKKQNDAELNTRMEYYARAEPTERVNELHSIIGTEFSSISPELEKYYSQYFSSRQVVVAFYQSYKKIFNDLATQSAVLLAEIDNLKLSITARMGAYNASIAQLEQESRSLKSDYSSLDSSNASAVNAYNRRVNAYNASAQGLNAEYTDLQAVIMQFNSKVKEYNDTAAKQEGLQKSLDSSLAPAPPPTT